MNALEERQVKLAQMQMAQAMFVATMDFINHSDSSYEDKHQWAMAYQAAYPLFGHNRLMMNDALESINPVYMGMVKHRICGVFFFVKRASLELVLDTGKIRHDDYLAIETGKRHVVGYSMKPDATMIMIDGETMWIGKTENINLLLERGESLLLNKLNILPF